MFEVILWLALSGSIDGLRRGRRLVQSAALQT